ncbi:hypothetical protein EV121DRAFT_194321 [Schizophyllum commune]
MRVVVCHECHRSLIEDGDKPPKFSLANDMWIGPIPHEVEELTIPEQLLLALVIPRVFVFKLRPKLWSPSDPDMLQRGMRGNVSSYELDQEGIVAMVAGDMLPRPVSHLPSVLSVTYVGPGKLPPNWIYRTFRVRRELVRRAFLRLKGTNPNYFGDISLCEDRLAMLPEDDVPDEIMACVLQNMDVGALDEEHGGYVPSADHNGVDSEAASAHKHSKRIGRR